MKNYKILVGALTIFISWVLQNNLLYCQEGYGPETPAIFREFDILLPGATVKQKLMTRVIGGKVIYQDDIILGTLQQIETLQNPNLTFAVAIDGHRWPNSIIPYVLPVSHPKKTDIQWAINHIQSTTNLCLVPKSDQIDYVEFVTGDVCLSVIGNSSNSDRQEIIIGNDCSRGSIAHEILHAAGLFHEQSRQDRDTYVEILWDNIEDGADEYFQTENPIASDIGSYDYGSIMHYWEKAFSRNNQVTIDVKVPPGTSTTDIGQRNGLSPRDISSINSLYPINSACKGVLEPGQSKNVIVTAKNPYNQTGIFVKRRDKFLISALSTKWFDGSVNTSCNGYASSSSGLSQRRHPDIQLMALTAEVYDLNKNSTGNYYSIGCGPTTITINTTGYLILYANDKLTGYGNNEGSIKVAIKRI